MSNFTEHQLMFIYLLELFLFVNLLFWLRLLGVYIQILTTFNNTNSRLNQFKNLTLANTLYLPYFLRQIDHLFIISYENPNIDLRLSVNLSTYLFLTILLSTENILTLARSYCGKPHSFDSRSCRVLLVFFILLFKKTL